MLFASDWSGWGEAMLRVAAVVIGGSGIILGLITSAIIAFVQKHKQHWWLPPLYILIGMILIPAGFLVFS